MRITIACRCLVGLFGALAFLLASTPLWAQQRSKVEVVAASYHGENGLLSLAFSPNGRFLVSGGLDNTARLWDLETGRLIRRFVGHLDTVSSVGFSPDGRFLLTGSMDNTVKLWEVASGRVVHTLKGRSSGVVSAVLSSDGHFALSGAHINPELTGRADHLTLWDLRKGAKIRTFEGRESTPELVALSPDGRYALSVDREGAFAIWNPLNGRSVRKLGSDTETFNPTSALFTPDSLSAIIASSSGLVRVLNIGSGKESQIALAKNNDGVRNVKLSPDGQRAIVDYESKLELVNVADKRVLQLLAGPSPGHRSPIAFSSDARFAVTSSDNGLTLWNLGTGQEIRRFRNHPSIAPQLVALSPDGQLGLSIAPVNKDYPEGDSTVTVWSNGRLLRRWKAEYVSAVAFSPDNRAFLALGRDGLTWWDAPTGSPIRALRTPFDALSADGHYALSGVAEGEQPKEHKLWDTATGEVVRTFASTTGAAAVSQDGQLALMYGDIDDPLAALILVEVSTGRARHVLKERPEQLRGVAISPDGKHALSVGCDEISFKVCVDSKVRIWDLSKGRLKHALAGHVRGISSATFSGDGKLVLSGGDDGTVRLWETASGRLIHTLAGHTTSIRSVAFDGSAKRALSGSEDGALRMWDLVAGKELAATLMLPQDEWLTITPPGFFSSSARADTELLSIVRGVDVTTIGQLHQSVYSPDLVREAVVGDVNREVERAAQVMSLEKVLDSGPAPQITLASQASESKSDLITIEARIPIAVRG